MSTILDAYFVVSIVCAMWVLLRGYITHSRFPEEMEELYVYVGFGFLWFVSVPWTLYEEYQEYVHRKKRVKDDVDT
jgi:hypothetical protein